MGNPFVVGGARRWCECCREKRGLLRRVKGGSFEAVLCDGCVAAGHGPDFCKLCPGSSAMIWHCARLAHAQSAHPGFLEKLANDDFRDLAPKPAQKFLGTLRYPLD